MPIYKKVILKRSVSVMKKSTWVLGAAALLALSVAVAGCGGGDKKEAAPKTQVDFFITETLLFKITFL